MKQRFSPYGTVSARPEFRDRTPDTHRSVTHGVAASVLDSMSLLAESFDIDDAVFFLAWELIMLQPGLTTTHERRAALTLVLATLINTRQGSTCLPLPEGLHAVLDAMLTEHVREVLDLDEDEDLATQILSLLHGGKLDALVAERGDETFKPLVLDAGRLYHQRMLHYEGRLIDALNGRFAAQVASIQTNGVGQFINDVRHGANGITLTDEQAYAVLTAVHLPMTIITGGPGTGKTSIVVALLRLMARMGIEPAEIALAAPTGKAANRMMESIDKQLHRLEDPHPQDVSLTDNIPKPQTLHRLLGYSRYSHNYHHHEHNPLKARVVIVDEASMIDMFLMERLIRAVPDEAHLVLLGDVDQLPSVDAGAVLRDLAAPIGSNETPWRALLEDPPALEQGDAPTSRYTVRLTRSHRMREDDPNGRRIALVSQRIRDGEVEELVGERDDQLRPLAGWDAVTEDGALWLDGGLDVPEERLARERLHTFLAHWYDAHGRIDGGFEPLADRVLTGFDEEVLVDADEIEHVRRVFEHSQRARLLSLTRGWMTGTRHINEVLLERLRAELGARPREVWLPGAPVMMLRNDYDKEIFNGDQGVILPARRRGAGRELVAFFPRGDGFVGYGVEGLRANLEVCWAMTVHKSQGSEFERVGLILPREPIPLLTREVLYTAITRSHTAALILGPEEVLKAGVASKMHRYSALEFVVA